MFSLEELSVILSLDGEDYFYYLLVLDKHKKNQHARCFFSPNEILINDKLIKLPISYNKDKFLKKLVHAYTKDLIVFYVPDFKETKSFLCSHLNFNSFNYDRYN